MPVKRQRTQASAETEGGINWANIRTLDEFLATEGDRLYDDSPPAEPVGVELADDLTDYEVQDAMRWAPFTRGVIVITGVPGSGKTLLMHVLAWKFRRYFRMLPILDAKPKRPFGEYILYSSEFLVEQCRRIDLFTSAASVTQSRDRHWYTERGEIFLRHAVIGLDELKRYLPRDAQMDSVCQLWLSLFTLWRHLESVIIGACTKKSDLTDACYPEITCEVKCQALAQAPGLYLATLYPLRYNTATMSFNVTQKPVRIVTDVLTPITADRHPPLAGHTWGDIYHSWNAQSVRVPRVLLRRYR